MGPARAAADVFVLQDGTPLVSKPGVGGKILLWVDTGFPLTVVGQEGDWLRVSSFGPQGGQWRCSGCRRRGSAVICRVRSTSTIPRKDRLAHRRARLSFWRSSARSKSASTPAAGSLQPDKDDFIDVINETPVELDVSGPGADCTVSKLGDSGTIDVALRTGDGQTVATATTYTPHGAVRVRTAGSWGGPSGTRLPTRFAFFRHRRGMPFPPGNPRSAARQSDAGARQSRACIPAVAGTAALMIRAERRKRR